MNVAYMPQILFIGIDINLVKLLKM